MKRIIYTLTMLALCCVGCTRRPLTDVACGAESGESVRLEVSVDWSLSRIESYMDEDDAVHRVSFRFFPTDGSKPFDRYLEGDTESGELDIPAGEYSVVIFNESIEDSYWSGSINFESVDSYPLFAATIAPQDSSLYFYEPADDESLSVEALFLASCSIEYFVVSEAMCSTAQELWTEEDLAMAALLNPVAPRPLCCYTTIEVQTENLSSAYSVHASLTGLTQRVFMASGLTDTITTTHVGELQERVWEDNLQHGVIRDSRLTFSTPQGGGEHILTLDVMLTDGSHHSPDEELVFYVTDQITSSAAGSTSSLRTRYTESDLSASVSMSLPEVSGDVEVEAWDDESLVTIL